ncbi:lysophospholipid acyltransferase family protein [Aporhodopirellula aestuarii]|uniref:Lysophospholipid acyltransferase family protein n=1 Tax=Aporhodopirellula aestuarii TaxID=2950107 RepID=A0ABT0UBZ7_9BACT|nr:lysophospholipid acyltransferase family protein [Aporhodopirellula aestuarii]MCM2374244.1 lysophospholipid acyltransferase family protein [Aporhodopirellula aestuarii]
MNANASTDGHAKTGKSSEGVIAPPAAWFQNGFHRFLDSYLKRHFHAIAFERTDMPAAISRNLNEPVIVYCNHPSWWDPLLAHYVNRKLFAPRQLYAPIDAAALKKYQVFEKLGLFGVELHSSHGAAAFLKTTAELFRRSGTALWLTPEGRFTDVRDDQAELMPGLSHLCSRTDRGLVVPMSLEYAFWEERLPECLIRFGEAASLAEYANRSKAQWAEDLTARLRDNQAKLAELVIARSAEPFENLLHGKSGASGIYDWARRLKSWMSFHRFDAAHGDKFGSASDE